MALIHTSCSATIDYTGASSLCLPSLHTCSPKLLCIALRSGATSLHAGFSSDEQLGNHIHVTTLVGSSSYCLLAKCDTLHGFSSDEQLGNHIHITTLVGRSSYCLLSKCDTLHLFENVPSQQAPVWMRRQIFDISWSRRIRKSSDDSSNFFVWRQTPLP